MDPEERREFRDYVEDCKRAGHLGSAAGSDFTYAELQELAREFLREVE